MDTSNKNNIPQSQGEAATFGEYAATSSTNGSKTQSKEATQSNAAAAGQSGYQKTTNEIGLGGNILKETSGAAKSGDNHTSPNVNGYGTYLGSSADISQGSSPAGGENAQFGEYKATTKVNGVESTNAKPSDGNTKITQVTTTTVKKTTTTTTGQNNDTGHLLGDYNTGDTTTKFNFEEFNFGSTDEAFQSETGVTLGNLKTTATKGNLGFEQFGSSVDHLQSMDNKGLSGDTNIKTDFDLDAYLKNEFGGSYGFTNTSPNFESSPAIDINKLTKFEQNNDNVSNVNLAGFTTDIPEFNIKPTTTTTTTTVTTSSPIIESIPISTSNLKVAPKIETIYKEQAPAIDSGFNFANWQITQTSEPATIKKEEVKNVTTTTTTEKYGSSPIILNAPKPLPTSNQIIEKTTITTSTPVIETTTYLQPPVQIKQEPSKVADTGVTLKNLNIPAFDNNAMYQQNQTTTNITNIDEFLIPSIPTIPVNIPEPIVKYEKYTQTSPVMISAPEIITSVPSKVTTTTVTTQNLGNDILFGDYKTSSTIPPIDFTIPKLENIPPVQTTITSAPSKVTTTTFTTHNLDNDILFGDYKTSSNIPPIDFTIPKLENIPPVETTITSAPSTVTRTTVTTQNLGNDILFGDYKTSSTIPPIDFTIPKLENIPPVQTTITPTPPPTVTTTVTTQNLGNEALFNEYKTTTNIDGVQTQYMPQIDAIPTFTQNITVPSQISIVPPPPAPITIRQQQPVTVKVPKIQKVVVPKVKQVYVPNKKKIYVRRPPGMGSIAVPTTTSYSQKTFIPPAGPVSAIPRPGPTVQMIGRSPLPPRVANPTIGSRIVTVKPPVVPVPPRNSLLLAKAPGSRILTPQPGLPYAQGSVRVAQPLPYAQGSVRVAQPLPYAQGSVRVPAPGLPYAQGSVRVAQPLPYAQGSVRVAQPLPYAQGSVRVAQPGLPQGSVRVAQPGLPQGSVRVAQPILPYAQGSVRVPQPGLPIPQGSVPVAQPGLPQGSVRVAQPILPYAQGSVRVPQPGLPIPQGSVPVAQPILPYAQGSVRVPQAGLPYAQGSIPVPGQAIPQILPSPQLPVSNQPTMAGVAPTINPMMNANYLTPGLGMNRPNVYNASTYRTNLGRNASKYRNVNRNNTMGNMSNTGQYTTRTYNARRL